jgi:predicted nuclease of restriction endonuclease-like (RecB) superfamily
MNYYTEIKNKILDNEITKRVKDYSKNKSDLNTYYEVGRLLSEAGKHYGEGIIKEYSKKLSIELNSNYNITALKRMRKFYLVIQKGATLSHFLSISHYYELLPLDNISEINYYIDISITNNLSIRELRKRIKSNEYERLPMETRNKIIKKEDNKITDLIKNPILINNNYNYEIISEKVLQGLILEDIPSFLEELGEGFTFIKNEYKIKIGDRYNYIDLLLYNINYNCYVVIELKVTELKKEHIGQIETYMAYIDKNIKRIDQDKTIGIIIVRKDNKYLIEYSSDPRIISLEYELKRFFV